MIPTRYWRIPQSWVCEFAEVIGIQLLETQMDWWLAVHYEKPSYFDGEQVVGARFTRPFLKVVRDRVRANHPPDRWVGPFTCLVGVDDSGLIDTWIHPRSWRPTTGIAELGNRYRGFGFYSLTDDDFVQFTGFPVPRGGSARGWFLQVSDEFQG